MGARQLIDSLTAAELSLKEATGEFVSWVSFDDDEFEATIHFGYESIGPGDADYDGKRGVSTWIEDILVDGKSVYDKVPKEQIRALELEAAERLTR